MAASFSKKAAFSLLWRGCRAENETVYYGKNLDWINICRSVALKISEH
jgi:hypothetical protein